MSLALFSLVYFNLEQHHLSLCIFCLYFVFGNINLDKTGLLQHVAQLAITSTDCAL